MNETKFRKIIAISLIVIVIIIAIMIAIMILINRNKEETEQKQVSNVEETQKIITYEDKIEQYDFLVVSNCVSSYISGINQNSSRYYGTDENNNYTIVVEQEQINKSAYDLLSSEYIESNGITIDNVYDYVPEISQDLLFVPIEMKLESGENVNKYMVAGFTTDLSYNFIEYIYVIVNLDIDNKAFSIEPIDNTVYNDGQIENNNIRVEQNDNNKFSYQQLSEEYRLKQYFRNYKIMLLSNAEIAYEFLDDNYREKCFGSLDNFRVYINNNRDRILAANLNAYDAATNGDYTEYIERDENDKYYIFNISNVNSSDFNVMLDTYVIGSAELQSEYNSGDNQRKVALNTMKFIYAINDDNYYYAYNLLDETFKNNNFATQEQFEEYVNNNFFVSNNIEDGTFEEEGGYYIYHLAISDDQGNTKNLTVVMQLLEGTDFVMSFSIQ